MPDDSAEMLYKPHRALYAGLASITTVGILIAMKAVAYSSGESASVLAALIDSCTDAAASLVSLLAIHISLKPADNHHRYGHGKIEGLAALLQAMLIIMASAFLIDDATSRFGHPLAAEPHRLAMIIMAASIVLSVILVMIQKSSLKYAPSLAVASDRAHYGADIIVNITVLVALFLQAKGAPAWIDAAVALGVGLWLLRTAWLVGQGGIDMLLDREVSDAERSRILDCVGSCPDVHGVHDLRTRMVGMNLNISFDIEVSPDLSLRDAHAIAHRVENCLLHKFPNAEIMIHVDPDDDIDDSRHSDVGKKP